MSEITMNVDQGRLVNLLKNTFSTGTTFIGELLQNARRAGASEIRFYLEEADNETVLTIHDNGRGIRDWDALVSIAKSDWTEDTLQNDKPFGVGFLSALFAAKHVTVCSGTRCMASETQHLIEQRAVSIDHSATNSVQGTHITLRGFNIDADTIEFALKKRVDGFPIPVFFDDQELLRPDAVDLNDTTASDIGQFLIKRLSNHDVDQIPTLYLQGLPIQLQGVQNFRHTSSSVLHLDSCLFEARMPDRDVLIEPVGETESQYKRIEAAYSEVLHEALNQEKQRLSAREFAGYEYLLQSIGAMSLVNDLEVVPRRVARLLNERQDRVLESNLDGVFIDRRKEPLTRDEIMQRPIIDGDVVREAVSNGQDVISLIQHYAYGIAVVTYDVPDGHWLHALPSLTESELSGLTVEAVGQTRDVAIRLTDGLNQVFTACEHLIIHGPYGEVKVDDAIVHDPVSGLYYAPANIDDQAMLGAIHYEAGTVYDSDHIRDAEYLISSIRAALSDDPSALLKEYLLDQFSGLQNSPLSGQSFTVDFDECGNATVKAA